jgi:cephalosporin-C deacetylase-like acetyl esterase
MNTIKCFLLTVYLLIGLLSVSMGQSIILRQTNETGVYKRGGEIRVTLLLKDKNTDSVLIEIRKDFSNQLTHKMVKYEGDTLLVFRETFFEPTTYILQASTKNESGSIGFIVAPEEFKPGTNRPKDFDKFWVGEKKTLRALPMSLKTVSLKDITLGYQCSDIEINCTGPKPVRGYFAKPNSAKPRSLPIVIYLHAAGVAGDWCRSEPDNAMRYAIMGKGSLSFDLNAHGMLNGQSNEYYNNLENGELKNYSQTGLESKSNMFFRGMYLRLIRTIDFLTNQPEWDGKRILVIGESQGGGQALAAAGLDRRVSAVVATVPAMCDWGGDLVGRKGSWPYRLSTKNDKEKLLSTVPYFDVAHILKGSKATIVVEIGLIDQTCPSSAVYAALNQAVGKKIVYTVPYRAHHMSQPAYKELWENTVNKPKCFFLLNYLQ